MIENYNKAVFTTENVLNGSLIVRVFHDNDDDWQFFSCNETLVEKSARIVSIAEILELEKSLKVVIKNLPKGYEAFRENDKSDWYIKYDDGRIENLN